MHMNDQQLARITETITTVQNSPRTLGTGPTLVDVLSSLTLDPASEGTSEWLDGLTTAICRAGASGVLTPDQVNILITIFIIPVRDAVQNARGHSDYR